MINVKFFKNNKNYPAICWPLLQSFEALKTKKNSSRV